MGSPGNLERLKIMGFADAEKKIPTGVFIAPINPSSIKLTYGINTEEKGAAIKNVSHNGYQVPTISFDLHLDSTGVVPLVGSSSGTVPAMIELFKKTCYYYQGGKHDIPYVVLQWGPALMSYKGKMYGGRLSSMEVNYSLFNPAGIPIRAKISATFNGSTELDEATKLEGKSSPDLTHRITIKAGDNLPNLCQEIYGDMRFYHQIARINNLSNFRDLTPGMELEFPPIK